MGRLVSRRAAKEEMESNGNVLVVVLSDALRWNKKSKEGMFVKKFAFERESRLEIFLVMEYSSNVDKYHKISSQRVSRSSQTAYFPQFSGE